jgi:hypothetical protein
MVREPDATMQLTPQDNQLMSKHRILSFKPQLRLEWRGQDGQNETEQPDHSANLGDSITASTRTRFSVHTQAFPPRFVHGRFTQFVAISLRRSGGRTALLVDEHLVPASDGLDNFVGICSPCEGFRFYVMFDDETIDCSLQVDDR